MMRPILLPFLLVTTAWASPGESLTREQAENHRDKLATEVLANLRTERAAEVAAKSITLGDKTLRWLEKEFGEAPEGKRSLWISMHGGGNAPAELNDQQWQNQIRLYQLKEGIYIAPRAPTNTWNLWHEGHIDPLFDRLIADMIANRGVDPNRVYLMGYSAGGDGVWQLAPRMADRFAAAAMMAGHPNEASLLGLRNLPFAIFVGGEDAAYDRNKIDAKKGEELDALQKADPKGYEHLVKVYPGLPHWMNGKDAEAVPWMAEHARNPWPDRIVWYQDDVTHDQFYWLETPPGAFKAGQRIIATARNNEITLEGDIPDGITLRLSDVLVDLDKEIVVKTNGTQAFKGIVKRTPEAISESIKARPDSALCPVAKLKLEN